MIDVESYMDWSANNNMTGVTCYSFVCKVLQEVFGIVMPTLKQPQFVNAKEAVAIRQKELNEDWEQVVDPKSGDVILLLLGDRRPHIGIMVDANSFLHFSESDKMVKRDLRKALQWRNRIDGFYRHRICCD